MLEFSFRGLLFLYLRKVLGVSQFMFPVFICFYFVFFFVLLWSWLGLLISVLFQFVNILFLKFVCIALINSSFFFYFSLLPLPTVFLLLLFCLFVIEWFFCFFTNVTRLILSDEMFESILFCVRLRSRFGFYCI